MERFYEAADNNENNSILMKKGGFMKKQGFTLLELLIVVVIIGILAITVFLLVSGARERAVNASAKNSVSEFSKALGVYLTENNDLSALGASGTTLSVNTTMLNALKSGGRPILSAIPKDGQTPPQPIKVRFDTTTGYTVQANSTTTGMCWLASTISTSATYNNLSGSTPTTCQI